TENVAIQTWIARQFPAAKLLPTDPMRELHAISLLAWCASGIHPFLSRINSPPRVCDLPGSEEAVRRLAQQQLFENYQIGDDLLADREWVFDHFTAVYAHFSGAFDAVPNSASTCLDSSIASRILSGCSSDRACGNC